MGSRRGLLPRNVPRTEGRIHGAHRRSCQNPETEWCSRPPCRRWQWSSHPLTKRARRCFSHLGVPSQDGGPHDRRDTRHLSRAVGPRCALKGGRIGYPGHAGQHDGPAGRHQWLAERVDPSIRKADQVRGYVERAILPSLGQRRVRNVEPSEIARAIRDYRDRVAKLGRSRSGGRPAARALFAVFKGLFGYAVASGWIAQSPTA